MRDRRSIRRTPTKSNKMQNLEDALGHLRETFEKVRIENEKKSEEFWNNLSYDEKLMAFYSVVKRIHKGELDEKGTYRYLLYNVFGFDLDAYALGIECGFLDLHNSIYTPEVLKEIVEKAGGDATKLFPY